MAVQMRKKEKGQSLQGSKESPDAPPASMNDRPVCSGRRAWTMQEKSLGNILLPKDHHQLLFLYID